MTSAAGTFLALSVLAAPGSVGATTNALSIKPEDIVTIVRAGPIAVLLLIVISVFFLLQRRASRGRYDYIAILLYAVYAVAVIGTTYWLTSVKGSDVVYEATLEQRYQEAATYFESQPPSSEPMITHDSDYGKLLLEARLGLRKALSFACTKNHLYLDKKPSLHTFQKALEKANLLTSELDIQITKFRDATYFIEWSTEDLNRDVGKHPPPANSDIVWVFQNAAPLTAKVEALASRYDSASATRAGSQ